eukprot:scaffold58_cov79-Skeletonema_marinoi.AAC.15
MADIIVKLMSNGIYPSILSQQPTIGPHEYNWGDTSSSRHKTMLVICPAIQLRFKLLRWADKPRVSSIESYHLGLAVIREEWNRKDKRAGQHDCDNSRVVMVMVMRTALELDLMT